MTPPPDWIKDKMDPLRFRHVTEHNEPDIVRAGDALQSEASRMAEWILQCVHDPHTAGTVPYEVHMAALGAQSAVERWTKARINR